MQECDGSEEPDREDFCGELFAEQAVETGGGIVDLGCAVSMGGVEVLEKVAHHRKWATRYPIRKALSANPYTPHPIAARLMGAFLQVPQLLLHIQMQT